jgi:Flp pilus assembly protein TadG
MAGDDRRAESRASRSARLLRAWATETRGAVAAMTAIAIVPLCGAVGIAVDMGRAYFAEARLSHAVDAAALAGGRVYSSDDRDADIERFFDVNFPEGYLGAVTEPLEIIPDDANRSLGVAAHATIPTTFMQLLGWDSIDVGAYAEAKLESVNLEVSLVLDITGSMAGQRVIDLRSAASELVDIVVQDQQDPFYSKVALVPYAMGVNVGTYAAQVRGTYTNNTCTYPASPTCRYYRFQRQSDNNWTTHEISTCVSERTGVNAFTDVAPSTAPLGRSFPPAGTYNPCITNTIVPLSSSRTLLQAQIGALQAGGSTGGHIGVAWGWYLLSPNFAYLWPAASQPSAYGEEDVLKVAVIMTDGEYNSIYRNGVIARNSTTGSGSNAYKINVDALNGSAYYQAEQLCAAMKAAGVIVYTVGLDVINTPAAHSLVNNCATDADHVYLPNTGVEMVDAFRTIAMSISRLRLSR